MKNLRRKAILILAFIFLIGSIEHTYPSQSFCSSTANYERIYNIQVSIGIFRFTHRLYVSVTPSLYEFYRSQNHRLTGYIAYQKFVTPEVVKPIAESIWHIIPNCSRSDELFANAVLTLFQQFRYAQSNVKYPIETIVNGSGDCDVFSVLAASIMKAGGLDVILLYYKDAKVRHMNVGVYLSHIPAQCGLWSPPTYYEYKEKKYWVCECTPQNGLMMVGQQLNNFRNAKPLIIPLDENKENIFGRISASIDKPLQKTSMSITISQIVSNNGGKKFMVSGLTSPKCSNCSVIMYVNRDEDFRNLIIKKAHTSTYGNYSFTLDVNSSGVYYIRTSLNGCSDHAGSDSEVVALFVKLRNPLEELTIPNIEKLPDSPQLRAQYAALVRMSMPRDISEISSRKIWMMGSGVNFTLSCEFAIFKGGGKTDSKFGLVIKQNSLYKSILASDTLLQMIEDLNGTERPLVNSPLNLMENKWYKITAKISGNQIIAELCGEKLYSSVTYAEREALGAVECGISIECGENVSIAFKNFKFEKLESIGQSIDSVGLACNHQIWIWQTLLIIATLKLLVFLALVSHTKKRCYKR